MGAALLNNSSKICVQNPEAELEPRLTSEMELFVKIVHGLTHKKDFFETLVNS